MVSWSLYIWLNKLLWIIRWTLGHSNQERTKAINEQLLSNFTHQIMRQKKRQLKQLPLYYGCMFCFVFRGLSRYPKGFLGPRTNSQSAILSERFIPLATTFVIGRNRIWMGIPYLEVFTNSTTSGGLWLHVLFLAEWGQRKQIWWIFFY